MTTKDSHGEPTLGNLMKYKGLRLKSRIQRTRDDMIAYVKTHGYISFPQAVKFGKRRGLSKGSSYRVFDGLPNVGYIKIWNPGNIRFINDYKICPDQSSAVVAKYVGKDIPKNLMEATFCILNAEDDDVLRDMVDTLERKNFQVTKQFPPLLNEYIVIEYEGERKVMWSEGK